MLRASDRQVEYVADEAKYRIQTVAEMTGVPAATLRAWERRYGIPAPNRTSASYRLYSDADIRLIRRLRQLCDEGMAPAEAAKLLARDNEPVTEVPTEHFDPFQRAQDRILQAIDRFDADLLEHEVRRAMFLDSTAVLFERIMAPVMRTVGDRWHDGTLSVAQEHMTSEVLGAAVGAGVE